MTHKTDVTGVDGMWTRRTVLGTLAFIPLIPVVGGGHAFGSAARPPGVIGAAGYPVYDIKTDFGAAGTGDVDDHPAFRRARDRIEANKALGILGATLIIPAGTYRIGKQSHVAGQVPYYRHQYVFDVSGLDFLEIRGEGATAPRLKLRAGLRFGSFHPQTGQPYYPGGEFYDQDYKAQVGHMFELVRCSNVTISNLELDGSSGSLVIGGTWGDKGYQLESAGIWLNECSDVAVRDVYTHHHGKDGITVLHLGGVPTVRKQHTLTGVRSEYNARQGLSWIGGWGLKAERCRFNHTGRAVNAGTGLPLVSAPGAGVDIEPNVGQSTTRDGYFYDCEMVDNAGKAMESPNQAGGHTTFERCTLWGTTTHALWANSPHLTFKACNIYGHFQRVYSASSSEPATTFVDCAFEDKEYSHPTRKVYREGWLIWLTSSSSAGSTSIQGVGFTRCSFVANKTKGVMVKNPDSLTGVGVFTDCGMEHRWTAPANGELQAEFNGSRIQSCDFTETLASGSYFIKVNNVVVATPAGSDPTNVEGPRVKWRSTGPNGLTGDIPDNTY